MQRSYFIALMIITFLSVPETGNSSVSATNLNNWGDLNLTLDPFLSQQNGFASAENQEKLGYQSSEPRIAKKPMYLMRPNSQYDLAEKYNFESSSIIESPIEKNVEKQLNIPSIPIKLAFNNSLDIPSAEVDRKFFTYVSLQNKLFKPSIEDVLPSLLLDDSFLYQNYPEPLMPVIALIRIGDQKLQLYERGRFLSEWDISSARAGKITPRGSWTAKWLSKNHKSSIYDGAEMPFSVFFDGDYAIHGTRQINRLGEPASAGCIRLHPDNAKIFFDLAMLYGVENTLIRIIN